MEKILTFGDTNICLFCGNEKKQKWDECESYYECDCKDAKKEREIKSQIQKLEDELPEEKFEITQEYVLRDITNQY